MGDMGVGRWDKEAGTGYDLRNGSRNQHIRAGFHRVFGSGSARFNPSGKFNPSNFMRKEVA
jgi:hypothetical protein